MAAKKKSSTKSTVATRRTAKREEHAGTHGKPGVRRAKVEIDLTRSDARKKLLALYPHTKTDAIGEATKELEQAALEYIKERDVAKLATERKELAGHVLCNAIGSGLGLRGDGWEATWPETTGNVDWAALAKDHGIDDETIETYRRPGGRVLKVTEVAS